ncbi:MAG: GNAT family N-acetyltransferase [Burkholderiaceae bacterium]|nr:GNAT family N-acetyltransferase [Ideonella sp.]MCC7285222.1 GNAT family N-acetyltransferase [Burkholderiaceae bacterium]
MRPRRAALSTASASTASAPRVTLLTPQSAPQFEATRAIFREYAAGLGVDLCFQNFEAELASLPGEYAAPRGALLLATVNGELAGCGACRALADVDYANACEMKRLYVRPAFRGLGLGRLLARALMDHAIRAGYSVMLLDTLDDMEAARSLYEALGFEEIPPYYFNPIAGAHYLKAQLD